MNSNSPLVSVIIPTYRRSEFLVRAIKSVVNQTYNNLEIIVVDDNNGNDKFRRTTIHLIHQNFPADSLVYIEHNSNKGVAAARNTGIKAAKGEYVAFLDDDDEWLPSKVEKQMQLFMEKPDNYGVISCGWNFMDSVGKYSKRVFPNCKGDLSKLLAVNHFSPPSMIIVKRHFLDMVGGFDENFKHREDIELLYRLANYVLFEYVQECLVNYYYHSDSKSRNFNKKLVAVNQFIDKHGAKLVHNKLPWSEIHERKGEWAAASGYTINAIVSFIKAYVYRPLRIQILGKLLLSFLGPSNYIKFRGL